MNDIEETVKSDQPINEFRDLFLLVKRLHASDLHLQVGSPPILRIGGVPKRLEFETITPQRMDGWVRQILSLEKYELFMKHKDFDCAFSVPNEGRMRVNLYFQRGSVGLAGRLVQTRIPTVEELHLPPVLKTIADFHDGLVILAGVTGSGKSTSLAAMIEHINQTRSCHILTIEDPIEYLYRNKYSFINQREVGIDTDSFKDSLRYALREDPDIMLIGEMRDAETIQYGLNAAETGHLVFGTLHSSNAASTIGRIIDLFPPDQHNQIRQALQFNLRAIVCQKLLPCIKPGIPRVPAVEVMISDPTIRELIRKAEDVKIHNAVRAGSNIGMQDFNKSILHLVQNGFISEETALRISPNPEAFRMNMKGIFLDDEKAIF
jgi:twitching motility protein PilT